MAMGDGMARACEASLRQQISMRPCRLMSLMHLKADNAPVARINPAKAFWRRMIPLIFWLLPARKF
jgi:hypothetical protein